MYKTGNSSDKTGYRMKAAGCFETSAAAHSNLRISALLLHLRIRLITILNRSDNFIGLVLLFQILSIAYSQK